jgi:hypothetical protein
MVVMLIMIIHDDDDMLERHKTNPHHLLAPV